MTRRPSGFTLIEILISVSIISVLIAVLLPSLRRAKDQAKLVVCENNLRSIWTGIVMYSYEYRDRVPFMEDVNLTDPNADPFDPAFPTTVGNVLLSYVNPGSWRCPAAVGGYPANAGPGNWKITYTFSSAGAIGKGVPYDDVPLNGTGHPLDPAISNYVHFDGRPMRLLDGRRYVAAGGLNQNEHGTWSVKRAIIAEVLAGKPLAGKPTYPHNGAVEPRRDLQKAQPQFESNTRGNGFKPSYHELHADGDKARIYLTRFWQPHWPGY